MLKLSMQVFICKRLSFWTHQIFTFFCAQRLSLCMQYLNYYFSYDVCACLSECLSEKKTDPSKMDQTRKFGEQTSRILEFKPEGLDF
jgi:hypothetical protein